MGRGISSVTLRGLALIALALGSCAKDPAVAPPTYLQADISVSPTSLDPRFATDAISERIDELIHQGMVRADRAGNFVGNLAQTIDRPAPTSLIFHLRRGVRFSDGRELTAFDVEYTYDSVRDPASQSLKRAAFAAMSSMRILDRYTIEMTTRQPYAPALAMATLGVIPTGTPVAAAHPDFAPPGTGPFRLAHFERDEAVVLARNPYFPSAAGAASGIVFKVVPDATVRALELIEGVCDFTENDGVQPDLIPFFAAHRDLEVSESPGTTFQYLIFNFRDPRLRQLKLRRAIAYAIDRERIVSSMLRGTARVATGMLAPENWAYDGSGPRYSYDPAAARHLLEEAGYRPGDPSLRFVYKTTPEGRRLAEVIQAMLLQVGIRLEIRTNEWATFYADLIRGNFDLASSQLVGINDPHQYYLIYDSKELPPRGMNRGAYDNPAMDRVVEAGDTTLDPVSRREIYARVQQLAAIDLPYVPLWWMDNVAVLNRRLRGFEPYPNGSLRSLATAHYLPSPARRRFDD
jgi:peptide/nickel transport system substrate-binding protein